MGFPTTTISRKRSRTPPHRCVEDRSSSPVAYKQPRLDAPLSTDTAKVDVKTHGLRVPNKLKSVKKSGTSEMGPMETTFLSTQLEVDDSSEYKEALLAMEGLIARSAYPTRQHIRQVLSLCFFPLMFKPPTRVSAFAQATSSSSISTRPVLPAFDQDPYNLSHQKLRGQAKRLLDDIIATNGVDLVCRSIRGYGLPKLSTRPSSRSASTSSSTSEDPFTSTTTSSGPHVSSATKTFKNAKAGSKRQGKGKEKSTSHATRDDSEEDLEMSDSDDVLAISAKWIGRTENLWDFLAGTTAKKPRVWTREQPILTGGWEILRSLVDGWDAEYESRRSSDSSIRPLSLLRYFKPSATSSCARELSSKALDTAFWPFTDSAQPASRVETDGSDVETDDSDLFSDDIDEDSRRARRGKRNVKGARKPEEDDEVKFEGEMSLEEKKRVGIRLLLLIGESATNGHLDAKATLAELVQRMKALDHTSFPSFLELLSLYAPLVSPFLSRLLAAYLDSQSHHVSAVAALKLPSFASISSLELASISSSDTSTSPRKRALAASSSLSSLPSLPGGSQAPNSVDRIMDSVSSQRVADVTAEYWKTPTLDAKEFLVLMSRIPIEVALHSPRVEGHQIEAGTSGEGRKSKGIASVSFDRATRAAECHRLVKEILLALKVDEAKAKGTPQHELVQLIDGVGTILQGVEEVVRHARTRCDGQRTDSA